MPPMASLVFDVGSNVPDKPILEPASDDLTHFSGPTSEYDINSNAPVFDGTYSLKFSDNQTSSRIYSSSGLANYPQVDKTHVFFFDPQKDTGTNTSSHINVHWGWDTSSDSGYSLTYVNSEIRLRRWESGSVTDSKIVSYTPLDNFQSIEILHEADGTLSVEIRDASTVSFSNYRDGSIQLSTSWTDATHITNGSFDYPGIALNSGRDYLEVIDAWYTE